VSKPIENLIADATENLEKARKEFTDDRDHGRELWRQQEALVKDIARMLGIDVRQCRWITKTKEYDKYGNFADVHKVDGIEFYVYECRRHDQDESEPPVGVELRHGHIFNRSSRNMPTWLCVVKCTWFDSKEANLEAAIPVLVEKVKAIEALGQQDPLLVLSGPQQDALVALLNVEESPDKNAPIRAHYSVERSLLGKGLVVDDTYKVYGRERMTVRLTNDGRAYAKWLREYQQLALTILED